MTPNLLADVCLTAARGPHQPAARCRQTVDDKNISALLKISTATRKQFCTDYLPVVSNIGPLTMTQAERQLSPVRAAPAAAAWSRARLCLHSETQNSGY